MIFSWVITMHLSLESELLEFKYPVLYTSLSLTPNTLALCLTPCGQWEDRILTPKFTHWQSEDTLTSFINLTNWSVLFFLKKKKIQNHHPEKEYFIHAGLSNEGETIQYSKWNLKKKPAWISKDIWKTGKRIKNTKAPVIPAGLKLPSCGNPE